MSCASGWWAHSPCLFYWVTMETLLIRAELICVCVCNLHIRTTIHLCLCISKYDAWALEQMTDRAVVVKHNLTCKLLCLLGLICLLFFKVLLLTHIYLCSHTNTINRMMILVSQFMLITFDSFDKISDKFFSSHENWVRPSTMYDDVSEW